MGSTMTTEQLIEANVDAPADTFIRAIFGAGCTDVRDGEDDALLPSAREALELWYGVDELVLRFTPPGARRTFVLLIHQRTMDRPHVEDITDHGVSVEDVELLAEALDERRYKPIYRS